MSRSVLLPPVGNRVFVRAENGVETRIACRKHPTYEATARPTYACETCAVIWWCVDGVAVNVEES